MARSKVRTSLYPFAYMGTEASTPPDFEIQTRPPTSEDALNYNVGALWLVKNDDLTDPYQLWVLVEIIGRVARWVQLYPVEASVAGIFPTDSGTANAVAGELNVFGDGIITTSGAGNTITIGFDTIATDGQLIIGSTAGSNAWASITSSGATFTITGGSNTLNLETGNYGGATDFVTDSGTATVNAALLNVLGGSNINTSGAGATVTVNLNTNVDIPGTLTVQTLGRGVVQSDASGLLSASEGTDGQLLISSSSGAPAWANVISGDASITVTNGSNTVDLSIPGPGFPSIAFLAYQPSDVLNFFSTGSTFRSIGSTTVLGEIFDLGNDFDTAITGHFIAPQTGKYLLNFQVTMFNAPAVTTIQPWTVGRILTSNRSYRWDTDEYIIGFANITTTVTFSTVVDMDALDTAFFQAFETGTSSGNDFDLIGDGPTILKTWMSGAFIV